MKDYLWDYLEEFVTILIVKEEYVPIEVCNAIALPYEQKKQMCQVSGTTGSHKQLNFDDFVDQFCKFIIDQQSTLRIFGLSDFEIRLSDEVDRCLSLSIQLESLMNGREEQAVGLTDDLKQLRDLQNQFAESLKFKAAIEELNIRESEIKLDIIVKKSIRISCKSSLVLKAFQRLYDLLHSEKSKWDKILRDKKHMLTRYEEVKDCKEYHLLLAQYIKLLNYRRSFEYDVT